MDARPARAGGPRRRRCCASSTTARSPTTPRACCGSPATPARLGFTAEPHTAALAERRRTWPASAASGWARSCGCCCAEPQPAALAGARRATRRRAAAGARPPTRTGSRAALAAAPADARARPARARRRLARPTTRMLAALGFTGRRPPRSSPRAARAPELRAALDRAAAPVGGPPRPAARARRGRRARRRRAGGALDRRVAPRAPGDHAASDLLAAGLAGPAVGAGLEAAAEALLDGRAPDRESQLAAALDGAAPRPPPRGLTPSTSTGDGTCASTTTPITVAVAGSSETSSAYVARGSRAIASWSQTYGITEEATPTPMPGRDAPPGRRAPAPRPRTRAASRPRAPRASTRRARRARCPAPRGGRARCRARRAPALANAKREPERLALEPDAGRARRRRRRRAASAAALRRVRAPSAARAITGRNSIAATVAERQPVDREVEAAVHQREHAAELRAASRSRSSGHGRRQAREHHRRGRDPQPGGAERPDADEQQHGERRAEVVEDGADGEVGVGREPPHRQAHLAALASPGTVQIEGIMASRAFGSTARRHEPPSDRRSCSATRARASPRSAARVGLSAPAVGERLARLEEAGVIRGYHADVDPARARAHAQRRPADPPRAARDPQGRRARAAHARGDRVRPRRPARTASSCAPTCATCTHLEELIDRFVHLRADHDLDRPVGARPRRAAWHVE